MHVHAPSGSDARAAVPDVVAAARSVSDQVYKTDELKPAAADPEDDAKRADEEQVRASARVSGGRRGLTSAGVRVAFRRGLRCACVGMRT